jgi:hypothetical protein
MGGGHAHRGSTGRDGGTGHEGARDDRGAADYKAEGEAERAKAARLKAQRLAKVAMDKKKK